MSKALIFADLHIHTHKGRVDRLQDCLRTLEWIFQTAYDNSVEYIFFLGDLFHERGKIDTLNYLRTFECFQKHMVNNARGIEMHLLVGNHDMYHKQRWDVNSIKPLTAFKNVHIVDEPCMFRLGGRNISWLPHVENPIDHLKALQGNGKFSKPNLLLSHLALSDAQTNTFFGVKSDMIVEYDNDMVTIDSSLFAGWDLVVLGHYHGAQKLADNKVEYVGSPLQLNFGEAFQEKHVMILDLDTLERKYVVNDFSPKHLIITEQDIEDDNYDLNGQFVRCTIGSMGAQDLWELKKAIREKYDVLSFDFRSKENGDKNPEEETVLEDAKGILYKEEEMLEKWLDECDLPNGLNKERLLEIGQRIVTQNSGDC